MSTFYHANYVFPSWAPRLVKTAVIGAHLFYRLPGLAGAPGAFSDAYAGGEPVVRGSSYMARSNNAAAIPAVATAQPWAAPRRPARPGAVRHPAGHALGADQPARLHDPRGISRVRPVARRRTGGVAGR